MESRSQTETPRATLVPIPRGGLRGPSGVLLFLALILSCAAVGIGICAMRTASEWEVKVAEAVSIAACVLLCIHTWRIGHRAKGLLPILIIAAGFTAYLCDSFIPSGVLIGMVCGIADGALALTVMKPKQWVWAPLVPLIAYGATVLCSFDPIGSVACLLPLPAAWALSFGTRRSAEREDGPGRVGVICLTSLLAALALGGMVALSLYRQLGSLDLQTITTAIEEFREALIVQVMSMKDMLPEDAPAEAVDLFSRENAEMMVNSIINLLPGYLIVGVNLISAVSQMILQAALVSFGCGESLSDRVRELRMSTVSCFVFAAAYLVYLFSYMENGDVSTLAGTVAQNVYVILLPGLAFTGLITLTASITKQRPGCLTVLLLLVAPVLLFVAPLILAFVTIGDRILSFIRKKTASEGHPTSSDDDSPDCDPSDDDPTL